MAELWSESKVNVVQIDAQVRIHFITKLFIFRTLKVYVGI